MIPLVSKNSGTLNAEMMSKNINAEHESSSDDANNTATKPNNVDTELKENKSSDDEQTNIVNNGNPVKGFNEFNDEKNNIDAELQENEAPMIVLVCEHNKFGYYSIKDIPACSCDGYTSIQINDMLSQFTIKYENDNTCYFEVTIKQDLTNIGGIYIGYQLIDEEREEFKEKDYYDSNKEKWGLYMADYGEHHACINAFQLDADEPNDNDIYWKKGDIIGCAMIIESDGCVIIYYRNGKVFNFGKVTITGDTDDTISPYIKLGSVNNYALSDEVLFDVCFKEKDLRYNNKYSELICRGSARGHPVTLTNDLHNLAAIYSLKRNTTENKAFLIKAVLLWIATIVIAGIQTFAYFSLYLSFQIELSIEKNGKDNFEIILNEPFIDTYYNDTIISSDELSGTISLKLDDNGIWNIFDGMFSAAGLLLLFIYIGSSVFNTAAERYAIQHLTKKASLNIKLKRLAQVVGRTVRSGELILPITSGTYILVDIASSEYKNKSDIILAPVGIIFINEFDNLIGYLIAKWLLYITPDFWIINEMILFPAKNRSRIFCCVLFSISSLFVYFIVTYIAIRYLFDSQFLAI